MLCSKITELKTPKHFKARVTLCVDVVSMITANGPEAYFPHYDQQRNGAKL